MISRKKQLIVRFIFQKLMINNKIKTETLDVWDIGKLK